jgi:hypothetical protein
MSAILCRHDQNELIRNADGRWDLESGPCFGEIAEDAVDRGAAEGYRSGL